MVGEAGRNGGARIGDMWVDVEFELGAARKRGGKGI